MPVTIPDPAELNPLLNLENLVVKLYVNDVDLAQPFALGDFVEASFPGYEAADPPPMPSPGLFPDYGRGFIQGDDITWVMHDDGPEEIVYGYILILKTTAGELLLGAHKFMFPVHYAAKGDKFTFAPTIDVLDFSAF